MKFPSELRYTKEHEWVKVEGTTATIGITDFAQGELGDVVFVELEPLDSEIEQDDVFGTVEAVKTVSELYTPVSGRISAVNEELDGHPEHVNEDPYGQGWMIKVELSDPSQVDTLLTVEEYKEMVG